MVPDCGTLEVCAGPRSGKRSGEWLGAWSWGAEWSPWKTAPPLGRAIRLCWGQEGLGGGESSCPSLQPRGSGGA